MYCKVHCRFILQIYKKGVGTAADIDILIAVSGATTLAISGTYYGNVTTPLSIGYINLLGFFVFVPVAMVMA